MTAKEFLELKNIKPIYRLIDGKETGEFIVTPELIEEYAQQQVKNLTIPPVSNSVCCETCDWVLPEGRCKHPMGCEAEYEFWEQKTDC